MNYTIKLHNKACWIHHYKIMYNDDTVGSFDILHEINTNELTINSINIGNLSHYIDIFRVIIKFINKNHNAKYYIINGLINYKYINNDYILTDIDTLNDLILDVDALDHRCKIEKTWQQRPDMWKYFIKNDDNDSDDSVDDDSVNDDSVNDYCIKENIIFFESLINFMNQTCYLYIKNQNSEIGNYLFIKKAQCTNISKTIYKNCVELNLCNADENIIIGKTNLNDMQSGDEKMVKFKRKMYLYKNIAINNNQTKYTYIIFDKPISFISKNPLNDLKFILKINDKYYTDVIFDYEYRFNKILVCQDTCYRHTILYGTGNLPYHHHQIFALRMYETDTEYAKNKYPYPYPQLINAFSSIYNDFSDSQYNKFPKYKLLPIKLNKKIINGKYNYKNDENEDDCIYIEI